MSQAQVSKLYRTFSKGLVTEASPLTFPPDTSYDEDNCLIFVAGNRSRRLGMDYEDDYELSTHELSTIDEETAPLIEYNWRNVDNIEGLDFLCHQVRDNIYFYDCSGSPTSPNIKSFSIDLSDYFIASASDPENAPVQMVAGKGFLFIVSEVINPLIVEYTELTDTISVESIEILIRDFDGVEDELAVEEEPTTLSNLHEYNLKNQGWYTDTTSTVKSYTFRGSLVSTLLLPITSTTNVNVIQKYKDVIGRYPSNTKQWFLGKVEAAETGYGVGDFNPTLLNKVHLGNSRAPRGHYIVNAFSKDRSAVSGVAGLTADNVYTRPNTCCFASGRIFFGHENNVYFSQILSEKYKAGLCFQDNDPTSEEISDLLANDGGVITLSSADKIILTKEVSNGIMVFANNGVWFIAGGQGGFSATDYQISKVSNDGTDAPRSVVDTEAHIYFWSKTGIRRLDQQSTTLGEAVGSFNSINLTENTIDTYLKDIPSSVRKYVKGIFDHGTNTVHWLFADSDLGRNYFYNRLLNYNIVTESFFPWSLTAGNYPYITGVYVTSDINRITNEDPVTVEPDDPVVLTNGDPVVTAGTTLSAKDSFIQFIVAEPQASSWKFTIGNFINDEFVDWETYDDEGVTYNSFVETAFEILEDAMRRKQITWLQPFFRQTEENFVEDGDDYTVDNPSSCYLTVKWDWSNTTASNKWSTRRQVYRLVRVPPVDPLDLTLNTGFKMVTTRNKIRGMGRALQFRFECDEAGKDFDLIGWQVFYTGNTIP